jgi:hypothetical protein
MIACQFDQYGQKEKMQIESYIFSKPEIIKSVSCQVAKGVSSVFELNNLRTVSTTFKNVIDKEEALLYCQIWGGNALACKNACKNHLIIEGLFNDLKKLFELGECSEYDIIEVSKELATTREKLKEVKEKAQFAFFTIFCNVLDGFPSTRSSFKKRSEFLDNFYDLQSGNDSGECSESDIKDVSKELALTRERLKEETAQCTIFTFSFDDYYFGNRIYKINLAFQGVIKVIKSLELLQLNFDSREEIFSTVMFISPTVCYRFINYDKQANSLEFTEKLRRITNYGIINSRDIQSHLHGDFNPPKILAKL